MAQRFPATRGSPSSCTRGPDDDGAHRAHRGDRARAPGSRCVAAGDVHMHLRSRKRLQDVMTAIRLKCPLAEAGRELQPNARALPAPHRPPRQHPSRAPARRHARRREPLHVLARRDQVRVSRGAGARRARRPPRTFASSPTKASRAAIRRARRRTCVATIEHELKLIAEMGYEPFFLTVHDIVNFARSQDILCQGRGSAANSAVCYCLGITEVDPGRMSVLFERFISKERNEPPDIDVDFEHQRREEVIQYIYGKYGRERAAHRRGGHHLPAEERAARRRQGARPLARPGRPARQVDVVVGRPRGDEEAPHGSGLRPLQPRREAR